MSLVGGYLLLPEPSFTERFIYEKNCPVLLTEPTLGPLGFTHVLYVPTDLSLEGAFNSRFQILRFFWSRGWRNVGLHVTTFRKNPRSSGDENVVGEAKTAKVFNIWKKCGTIFSQPN